MYTDAVEVSIITLLHFLVSYMFTKMNKGSQKAKPVIHKPKNG